MFRIIGFDVASDLRIGDPGIGSTFTIGLVLRFQVIVLNLGMNNEKTTAAAEKLYQDLQAAGLEVLLDDRDERPGSKFKDADLIGIPYRVTVGKTWEKEGKVELRTRRDGTTALLAYEQAVSTLTAIIRDELDALAC